jgi:hypothetical protein
MLAVLYGASAAEVALSWPEGNCFSGPGDLTLLSMACEGAAEEAEAELSNGFGFPDESCCCANLPVASLAALKDMPTLYSRELARSL